MFEISNEIQSEYAPVKSIETLELVTRNEISKQELLEISENISRYYAPGILSNTKKLVLLAIDPHHLYAYWNLGDNKDYALSKGIINGEVVLRVYSQTDGIRDTVKRPLVEIIIKELQSGQKIRLPTYEKSADYSASIGKINSKEPFIPLLNTNLSNAYYNISKQKISKINELDSKYFNSSDYNKIQHGFNSKDDVLQCLSPVKAGYISTLYSGIGKKK